MSRLIPIFRGNSVLQTFGPPPSRLSSSRGIAAIAEFSSGELREQQPETSHHPKWALSIPGHHWMGNKMERVPQPRAAGAEQ